MTTLGQSLGSIFVSTFNGVHSSNTRISAWKTFRLFECLVLCPFLSFCCFQDKISSINKCFTIEVKAKIFLLILNSNFNIYDIFKFFVFRLMRDQKWIYWVLRTLCIRKIFSHILTAHYLDTQVHVCLIKYLITGVFQVD